MSTSPIPTADFPRLIVRDVDGAIKYYQNAFGAELMERFAEPDGIVGFARLRLGDFSLALSEEVLDWGWLSPLSLGGSPVLIQLDLENCDEVADKMLTEKAEIVVPIKDRPHGKREGRLRDPFGHLWVLSQEVAR